MFIWHFSVTQFSQVINDFTNICTNSIQYNGARVLFQEHSIGYTLHFKLFSSLDEGMFLEAQLCW